MEDLLEQSESKTRFGPNIDLKRVLVYLTTRILTGNRTLLT